MRIELNGLELRGFHGVLEHEARDGQRFLFDVVVEVDEPAADDIDAAVDYRDLVACVRAVSDGTRFQLLETLAVAVAEELRRRFPVLRAQVRVTKPDVELEGGALASVSAER